MLTAVAMTCPQPVAAAPRTVLSPAGGPPGTIIVLRGAGFVPQDAVTVRIGGEAHVVRVDGDGAFVVRAPSPLGARANVPVQVRAGHDTLRHMWLVRSRGAVASAEAAAPGGERVRTEPVGGVTSAAVRVLVAGIRPGVAIRVGDRAATASRRGTAGLRVGLPARGMPPPLSAGGVRLALPVGRSPAPDPDVQQPRMPIRAAFYYAWFPEAWRQRGLDPFSNFHPVGGRYSSDDPTVLRRHVQELRYARQDAGIVSWSGVGSAGDRRLPALLRAARGTGLKWSVYYEPEGRGDPPPDRLTADVRHIVRTFGGDPAFLRVRGRPVIFVYAERADRLGMTARWDAVARNLDVWVVLKVFPGYRGAARQPAGWHQYAPAKAVDRQPGRSFSVSPGFWLAGAPAPRLARDVARFRADLRAMVAARDPWQLVTTFNEWGEGTATEPAWEWASASGYGAYLDALHHELR